MRYLKKSNLVVLIFALTISFVITGCYTQFSRPHVETEEDYYAIDEEDQPVVEDYEDYEPYYEDQEDSVIVNYNYYDVYNYDVPYYNNSYGGFGYPYNYAPYDLYYTGYYPHSWWDPYYHWRNPGWYVGYLYSDYYWNSSRYYRDYYGHGGKYHNSSPKNRRDFARRSSRLVDRKPRNDVPRVTAKRIARDNNRVARGQEVIDRNKRITTDRKKDVLSRDTIRKDKNRRLTGEAKPRIITKRKPVTKNPDKKYVIPRSRYKKNPETRVRPRTKIRKTPTEVKPRSTSRTTSKPGLKTNKPSSRKVKSTVRPRSIKKRSTRSYTAPRTKSSRSSVKPAVRKSVTPKSSNSSRRSYSSPKSSRKSSSSGSRPSTSSVRRSSPSRSSSGSHSSGSRSSGSSGSKSSGSKSSGSSKTSKSK